MHYSLHNKSNCSILSFRAFFCILSRFSRYLAWVLTCWAHIFACYNSINKKITRAPKARAKNFALYYIILVKTNACGAVRRRRRKIFEIWSIFKAIFRFFFTVVRRGGDRLSLPTGLRRRSRKFLAISLLILKFVKFSTKF